MTKPNDQIKKSIMEKQKSVKTFYFQVDKEYFYFENMNTDYNKIKALMKNEKNAEIYNFSSERDDILIVIDRKNKVLQYEIDSFSKRSSKTFTWL